MLETAALEYIRLCTRVRDLDWRHSVFIHLHNQQMSAERLLDPRHWSKHGEYSSKEKGAKILICVALSTPIKKLNKPNKGK